MVETSLGFWRGVQREGSYLLKGIRALMTIGMGRHNMIAFNVMFQQASRLVISALFCWDQERLMLRCSMIFVEGVRGREDQTIFWTKWDCESISLERTTPDCEEAYYDDDIANSYETGHYHDHTMVLRQPLSDLLQRCPHAFFFLFIFFRFRGCQ